MEGAIIGGAITIALALFSTTAWLARKISTIDGKVDAINQRLDRVDPEALRDRVTRIEARCEMCIRGD